MRPNFTSFSGELLFKLAQESEEQDSEEKYRSQVPTLAKERFKSSLKFGIGHGLGTGTGMVLGEKLLPKVLPKTWTPRTRKILGLTTGGMGAITALALYDAMREAAKAEQDALERDNQRV